MHKELIEHIREELQEFEMEYEEGAWERFQQNSRKKQNVIPMHLVARAAAVLLVFCTCSGIWQTGDKRITSHRLNTQVTSHTTKSITAEAKRETHTQTSAISLISHTPSPELEKIYTDATTDSVFIKTADVAGKPSDTRYARPKSMDDLFAEESNNIKPQEKEANYRTKWEFGLVVGQAMDSRKKGNTNFGASVSYRLNNALSVSSGVFYSQLGAHKNMADAANATGTGKSLTMAESAMAGVEIPLEIKYNLNGKFFAKAGLSAYAIARQQQILQFQEQKMVTTSFIDESGKLIEQSSLVNEISTEAVAPDKLKENKFVTLYNLSVGYRQRLTNQKSVSIEPFLKIPVTEFSDQKLNLSQAGVRLTYNF